MLDFYKFIQDEIIFPKGSDGDEWFTILQSEVENLLDPDLINHSAVCKAPIPFLILRRRQSFGGSTLVDQGIRLATARAGGQDPRLPVIPGAELVRMRSDQPSLGYLLMRNLAAHLAMKLQNTDHIIRQECLRP